MNHANVSSIKVYNSKGQEIQYKMKMETVMEQCESMLKGIPEKLDDPKENKRCVITRKILMNSW